LFECSFKLSAFVLFDVYPLRFYVYILIYLSMYLDQKTAKGPFRSSSQAATCYYQSKHSKQAIPLSALPKDTTSEFADLSPHNPLFMLNV